MLTKTETLVIDVRGKKVEIEAYRLDDRFLVHKTYRQDASWNLSNNQGLLVSGRTFGSRKKAIQVFEKIKPYLVTVVDEQGNAIDRIKYPQIAINLDLYNAAFSAALMQYGA